MSNASHIHGEKSCRRLANCQEERNLASCFLNRYKKENLKYGELEMVE